MAKTHKRVLSLVLSLVMVLSLLPIQAWAADPGAGSSQVSAEADGVVVNKEVTYDSGSYQLSLESYVTNEVTETETTTPLDIVLVLDVSGSMEDDMESYTYTSTGSQGWSYDDVTDWWSPTYYYKVGDQYYEVTGDYERKGNFPNRYNEYWLEYDYDGGTRLGNTARSKDATLWTGELYTRDQMSSIQKIAALKTAVNGFIGQVATNAMGSDKMAGTDDDITHKISIVKFADDSFKGTVGNDFLQDWGNYNYTQIVKDLTDVSGNGAETLKTAVNSLRAAGATSVDFGLELAEDVLNGSGNGASVGAREDAKQVVIVFTDGQPNHGSGFSESVAATAVNKAETLKGDGVTVFTVGVFAGANPGNTTEDFNKYMHGVSSNYPNATAKDRWGDADWGKLNLGVRAENSNYYLAASSADDLNAVFSSIASSIGTSKVEATESTVLTDTLSEYFAFPEGFDGSSGQITVTKVPVTGKTGDTYTWGTPVDITGQVSITVNGKNIQVTGFDYTDNAVTKTTAADGAVTWSGAKLVLTFPIVPDKTATWRESGNYATNSVAEGSQAGLTDYTVDDKPGSLTLDNSTGTGEDGSPVAPVSTYQVKYSWSGLPEDETLYNAAGVVTAPDLPTDNGYYIEGKTYTVDPTEYPVLYTHDTYGNVNGEYTFSGWTDPNDGTMVEGGVTITGTWSFQEVSVKTYTVKYDLNGGTTSSATQLEFPNLTKGQTTPHIEEPVKAPDDYYTYTFKGWDPQWSETVTGNVTYVAQYERTERKFTVTYMVDDMQNGEEEEYAAYAAVEVRDKAPNATAWTTTDVDVAAEMASGYFYMPARDVVFTATTQAQTDTTYQVITHYVARNGSEAGRDTDEVPHAQIGTPVSGLYTANEKTTYQGEQFLLDKVTLNGAAVNGTETLAEGPNVIDIYYDIDTIGINDPDGPDGEPDKNQVIFTYESADSTMGTVNLNKVVVTKDSNGMATAPQATATPNTGCAFVKWTESSYHMESTYADMSGLPLQHSVDTTFTAYFEAAGDPDPGPDPDPINVYFFAENGLFADGTEYYVTTVKASADGNYYLTAENLLTATANSGYQLVGTWKKNYQSANAPQVGDAVAADDMFVVTFAPEVVEPESYTVTYQWESKAPAGVALPTADTVPAGDTYGIKNPSAISLEDEDGYWTFLGWADGEGNWCSGTIEVNSDLTLRGTWDLQAKPEVEPQYFSVTWQNYDGTVLELDPQVEKGTMPVYNGSTPTRPGDMYYVYTFIGWTPTVSPVTGNAVYTATYQEMYIPPYIPPTDPGTDIDDPDVPLADLPGLNTVDHYAYIAGYEDGTVRPNNNITRAEVATIFFRLFTDEYRETYWSTNNPFSDVAYTAWYNNAVSTTSNAGIIAGYPDGTFQPNNYITRAEFATIAARFLSEEYVGPDLFTDISGHWAAEYINRAANAGWINGYPDGSFRPNAYITRAEAMTLVNSMLGRMPHKDHMLENMVKWPDNPEAAWYYEAVQEATNGHDYDWYEEEDQLFYEIWTALQPNRDWAALEKEWSNAYSAPGGEVIG